MEGLNNILQYLSGNLGIILTFLTVIAGIIEKSKTSWKPVSALFRWIGKKTNQDLYDKLEETNKKVDGVIITVGKVEAKVDANERDRIKQEILAFSNSLRDGKGHTKDEFQHIQEIYYKYHDELNGNGLITEEYEFIRSVYRKTYNKVLGNTYNEE